MATISDGAGGSISECSLSMSYCEGAEAPLTPRFTRGGRPVSAPLTSSMFDESTGSHSAGPHSPRVLEIVEKSESVSWKLEYEGALSSLPPPLPSTTSPAPVKRKVSPASPLVLRKCKSSGLMTQSLDMTSLTRSHSIGSADTSSRGHSPLSRTVSSHVLPRSNSVRRKILPSFETLCESTESDSDESKKNSPEHESMERVIVTPGPVDIGDVSDEEVCAEISSSSEIEIGVEPDHADQPGADHGSYSDSPDTEPETVTIRSGLRTNEEQGEDVTEVTDPASPDLDPDVDMTLGSADNNIPTGQ